MTGRRTPGEAVSESSSIGGSWTCVKAAIIHAACALKPGAAGTTGHGPPPPHRAGNRKARQDGRRPALPARRRARIARRRTAAGTGRNNGLQTAGRGPPLSPPPPALAPRAPGARPPPPHAVNRDVQAVRRARIQAAVRPTKPPLALAA